VKKEEWKRADKRQEKVDDARYNEDDPIPALGLASKKQTMMV